ncbi:hypothetical protein [Membranihabitans maritimus]|uniref:hypothetical protein n=1 Tax=Membranihabitans maritimus TaxID=2904244 RepID=UPI001F3D8B4F|nr:hypothetical protein [Membranihabitans maritimus]
MDRRKFVGTTLSGLCTIPLGGEVTSLVSFPTGTSPKHEKILLATTDYYDNILHRKFLFERKHLDVLHKYLASLGVTRHQWIVDTIWNFYDPGSNGFDLLAEAAESAQQYGIEFYAEIKPFEGGGFGNTLPLSLPVPIGKAIKDLRGIYPVVRPFVAKNPHLCLKRRPGTWEFNGTVSVIRLVKGDDKPTQIKPQHLEIWTSSSNNSFEQYEGPVSFRESVEWRATFPKSKTCRIINLEGLDIPSGHKYILIRCKFREGNGHFSNERGNIIELSDQNNRKIPFILSTGRVDYNTQHSHYNNYIHNKIVRYYQDAEVQEEFTNRGKAEKHYRNFYSFDERRRLTEPYSFDGEGYIVVACGKPEYMLGNLHPIYPEVREHWLGMIRFCLERGVDGINIRHSNHTRSPEDWEYGFNEPVIKTAGRRTDYPTIRRINGNAYTQFLRKARDLVKNYHKSIIIHLYSQMLMPDDRVGRTNYLPPNFEWQWETWVKEIADELEFRGAWTFRPENLRQVLETYSEVTKKANKPFYFQVNMKELSSALEESSHYQFTREELEMVQNNSEYKGFVLYETGNFTRINENGDLEGNADLEKLLKSYKWKNR